MPKGYTGKFLRVDLTAGTIVTEEYDDAFYRAYYGGRGFIGYFLMKEVGPEVDPLGPDNKLIFAMGPITGARLSGSGRSSVGAKSPLTGGYGEGDVGGFFGAELKHAGYDGIIFEGKSARPVYMWIHDGEAELRDAEKFWGMNTADLHAAMQQELGDKRVRTAAIGPGGENLVRFACVLNDIIHAAGRSGLGAVMGSKNLKAVVARGHGGPEMAEPDLVRKNAEWMAKNVEEKSGRMKELGTSNGVLSLNAAGGLPTRNFQTGTFEHADKISGEAMRDTILIDRDNCYSCVINCKRVVKVDGAYKVDPIYGGPEYETIGSLGSCCGIGDLAAIAKGNELCNAYGLDTIGAGTTIAWAMECFERGLITTADTDGIELKFGNADAMIAMIEKICRREGFGAVLAEGTLRAAQKIGKGSIEFAMQVKGQEFPMHEPRIKQALGVGYSLSPTGADHMHNIHDTSMNPDSPMTEARSMGLGIPPLRFDDIGPNKMSYYTHMVNWKSVNNCIGMCNFIPYDFDQMVEIMKGVTGWNVNLFEMMIVGERTNTLCRAYNALNGMTAKDDTLPKQFFQEIGDPKPTTAPLSEQGWKDAKQFYYRAMGWTEDGVPTKDKLLELGLDFAAEKLGY